MSRAFLPAWRFWLIVVVVAASFGAVWARLYYLQVTDAPNLAAYAADSRQRTQRLEARRGDITDLHGNLLATARPVIDLGVDPHALTEADVSKLPQLAEILKQPLNEVRSACADLWREDSNGHQRAVRWKKLATLTEGDYQRVLDLDFKAIYGNRRYERYYPANELAAHVVGYINKEGTPVMGVERYLDFYLEGQAGWRDIERDGRRRELAMFRQRDVMPTDGLTVQLTIDWVVQSMVEREIDKIVEKYNPEGVSIIVSDPRTGEIRAMGNYPKFDPNEFWEYPIENQRNRAVTDVYEPGSTFKIVAASGALEEGLVTPDTIIDCSKPVVEYRGRRIRMPNDDHALGEIPVSTVIAKSSNRGAATLGMMLGDQRMHDYAASFGFGTETGWGPAGEVGGILHDVKDWDGLTISRLPAGYAVSATPLQVHMAMSTIANDGVLMHPRVVHEIKDRNGNAIVEFTPRPRERVISDETARKVRAMLNRVVSTEGTARRAMIDGYTVAGKTGTSRKIVNGHYSHREHVGSFSGFFPVSDPQVVITVMVNNPRFPGIGYGGVVAAPAFQSLGEQLASYYAIPRDDEDESKRPGGLYVAQQMETVR
ncbi:MAG: cell division protein FtsI (penicillin-binding protein 3) [Puniceicoccaceae bacterium 5H]|nr:MAG: cell division protein FtsI (penicillin-binding protein 3) [Puniceicoccaceae bacterium 5H]